MIRFGFWTFAMGFMIGTAMMVTARGEWTATGAVLFALAMGSSAVAAVASVAVPMLVHTATQSEHDAE